ncbi:Uncharacterized protein OS=Methylobacterium nodulans (strain ORS2060 / LMG 21967) GN=Mnod_5158 PE=4 SV=1 [Gemmataceae bacterium]|nr:Uncharacterized protein OS=Methylobacterium nodulans (strain ORS2060 / LMG 21967) GN=Mnod_5158 PE=4 SV=1 [Gemmataceae bacterium]VTT99506.1 Uncharacterized protein OS=Methylobacterium nodulans (strain ORS2060 / LMG 21967) GN=Mnod_5158 PE=4 SV=1 [Gemmataceae bacterium]
MISATLTESRHPIKTSLPAGTDATPPKPLATFLGLFSLGLGLAEALTPRGMADTTGVRSPNLLRVYGVREIVSGVGILASRDPAVWLWTRVGGDALDLATLAGAYRAAGDRDRHRIMASAVAVLGVTVLDVLCAADHTFDPVEN